MFQKAPGRFASPPGELSFLPRDMGFPAHAPLFRGTGILPVSGAHNAHAITARAVRAADSQLPPYPAPPVPRIALFSDTLTDINGVARFVRALAAHAPNIHVLTSTRRASPAAPNIHNAPPLLALPMPGYPRLDLALPRPGALAARAAALRPDIVHVSTPGPVGLAGRRFALCHNLPLIGTYHTDFPAYIGHLFDDAALAHAARHCVRRFYAPFDRVLVRSAGFAPRLAEVGIAPDRITHLRPGIDTDRFHPRHRDPTGAIWRSAPGVRPASIKALYVGRVSVEKNLPMLTRLWPHIRVAAAQHAIDTQLLIVGDGPYRAAMQRDLAAQGACFLGFRHGDELSRLYASSDLFLFPSTTDTLGQAVMEAQASGLPAIVTDQGGPREIVEHGRTGLVLGEPAQWRTAALTLITDAPRRARMGAAARAHLAPMTIARSVEHFIALHVDAIATFQKYKPGHALARGPARR